MAEPVRFNPFSPSFRDDPYPVYAALRASEPVYRVFDTWVLTRYEDNAAVLRDRRFVSTAIPDLVRRHKAKAGHDAFDRTDSFLEKTIVFTENPDHARLRRLIHDAFSDAAIAREKPRIEEIVHGRFDAIRARDAFDVVSDIADPIPLEVTCDRLGIPRAMHETVASWTHRIRFLLDPGMMRPSDYGAVHQVLVDFYAYLRALLEDRRSEPRDDVTSRLLAARSGDDRLDDDEIIALGIVSFVAGHETTRYLIANAIRLLLENPAELEKVRRAPELIAGAVDETLRYDAPLQQTKRVAAADVEIGGRRIAKGEHVLICFGAGNRDPARFPDPDRFDVSRADKGHLGFGHGMRGCLGATLAHVEAEAALRHFLELGDVRPVDASVAWQDHSLLLRGPKQYRVRRAAPSAGAHPWLRGAVVGDKAARLLCVPHAGGGATSFNSWVLRLEDEVDVVRLQLPGREDRADEAPLDDIASVLAEACPAIDERLSDRPLLLYGHSLGAIIAFEIARHLEARGRPAAALLVSGRRAPQNPLRRPPMFDMQEAELVEGIVGLGGASARMMASPRWRDHFVPTMRADLAITDRYPLAPPRCLTVPIVAYRGASDPIVDADEMEAWSLQTRASFRLRTLEGGHFLAEGGAAVVIADVLELARACARPRQGAAR